MNYNNLPDEIKLDIVEYTPVIYLNIQVDRLIERIQLYDPTFSIQRILQDKMRYLSDMNKMKRLYAYKLFDLLDSNNCLDLTYDTEEDVSITLPYRFHLKNEIVYHYPDLLVNTNPNGRLILTHSFDDEIMGVIQEQLITIYYTIYRHIDINLYNPDNTYMNPMMAKRNMTSHMDLFNDPVYTYDDRSNTEIYNEIRLIDPLYRLQNELNNAMNRRLLLDDLQMNSLWDTIHTYGWSLEDSYKPPTLILTLDRPMDLTPYVPSYIKIIDTNDEYSDDTYIYHMDSTDDDISVDIVKDIVYRQLLYDNRNFPTQENRLVKKPYIIK